MADRRPQRLAALVDALPSAGVDGLLVTGLANIRYLTGFSGSSAVLFVSPRETLLVTDFRYQTQVADEVGDFARVSIESQSLWTGLWRALQGTKAEIIGFESAYVTHRDFQRLVDGGARWQWRPTSDLVEGLRMRKDADEVALIRQAAELAERALRRALPEGRPGRTELQVAGALEHALRDEGSEAFPFPTIVAAGARSALPHARSSARAIESGDFLLIDFGAVVGGYCADITRTFVVGAASQEQRAVYEVVRRANELASGQVRAGMRGQDADAIARRYIEDRGHGEGFGHSLGHGIGLEVHEGPRLSSSAEGTLPAGAVVTIEPGVYRPGWGGVRIEDDVHLDGDGATVLTSFTRDLMEI